PPQGSRVDAAAATLSRAHFSVNTRSGLKAKRADNGIVSARKLRIKIAISVAIVSKTRIVHWLVKYAQVFQTGGQPRMNITTL
ncbi:MAG: hypothetical protein ACRECN_10015, partial [Methylocella sp.]